LDETVVDPIHYRTEVLIVGFGPVGAALAGLLGRRGVNVMVVERDYAVFALPRAAHVDHTGLRVWQELGVLDELLPTMQENSGLDFVNAKHQLLARIPGDHASASGLPSSMYFYQPMVDKVVREAVTALPTVDVLLGTEVTDLIPRDQSVDVIADGPDKQRVVVTARWVVACDGAGSRVREAMGLTLADLGFEESWLVVDLAYGRAESLRTEGAVCVCDPSRPLYSIPMPFDRHRFEFRLMPTDNPDVMLDANQIEHLVDPYLPSRTYRVERSAIYTFHGLVANRWLGERVFLAGDAAHQMPPFLGQGMCSGLRDAANLAWKLHLVLRGRAGAELLDTYEEERRSHVAAIVEAAVDIGRIISTVDAEDAATRDRQLLSDERPPTQRISFALPGLRPGPLVRENGGELFIQPASASPRLDDVIGERFAVIGRAGQIAPEETLDWWRNSLSAFVATVAELPSEHQAGVVSWLDNHHSDTVVVRPDRYVLWSGFDLKSLTSQLEELFADAGQAGLADEDASLAID
jgi:3-(3-hydroxy-phenyl)propionate hydroxylase